MKYCLTLISAFSFNWYGFLIGFGMLLCIVIAYFLARHRGYYSDLVFDIVIICIPTAIIGTRLYYVIFDWMKNPDEWNFLRIFKIWEGGLAIYGGLIGGIIGAIIVLKVFMPRKKPHERVSFLQIIDLGFVLIFLGQAIGRWGNFFNQEAYGNLITDKSLQFFPYGVYIDAMKGWYQATFFYESMLNFVGFGLLLYLYIGKFKSFDGFIFSVYCIFYGSYRFFIEGLRSDSLMLGSMRVSQLVSVLFVIFGISFIIYHMYKARQANKKPFILVPQHKLDNTYYLFEKSFLSRPKPAKTAKPPKEEEEVKDDDKPEQ